MLYTTCYLQYYLMLFHVVCMPWNDFSLADNTDTLPVNHPKEINEVHAEYSVGELDYM